MGDMFRSEEMGLGQMYLTHETAYHIVSELGESGCVQFKDLNGDLPAVQRRFTGQVRELDESDRKLKYLIAQCLEENLVIADTTDFPKAPNAKEIKTLQIEISKREADLREMMQHEMSLKQRYNEILEARKVLESGKSLLKSGLNLEEEVETRGHLEILAGMIEQSKLLSFQTSIWRFSKGNVLFEHAPIPEVFNDPKGGVITKTAFVVFCQGEALKSKITKICAGYKATLHACPSDPVQAEEILKEVNVRCEDLKLVLNRTSDHRGSILHGISKELQNWTVMVSKAKAIYHTLNFFSVDTTRNILVAECWIPTKDLGRVRSILKDAHQTCGSSIEGILSMVTTKEAPPTFTRTNKFTQGFQNLIDSYGVATYQEANPALYTIITFPFLFAVMFGDIGHAIIMTLFGLWMVLSEKKIGAQKGKSEIFSIFFGGRYIILLMGIFSLYTGLIYNDMFGKSLNLFGSKWTKNLTIVDVLPGSNEFHPGYHFEDEPYFMGLDPVWQLAGNKIVFLNSYKMKLSIIFGVIHMMFGVCVGIVNHLKFKRVSSIFLEFLPQLLLLVFLFLYMVVMIFIKWARYSAFNGDDVTLGTACAPSVLIFFINMLLFKENTAKFPHCEVYMYPGQDYVQKALVVAALLCIPTMLLGKPLYVMFSRKKSAKNPQQDSEEEEEPMSEIFIHQIIHTIEYVLSTISHTASYLRLWALSLAHAQLSEVLWTKLFNLGLAIAKNYMGVVFIFVAFSIWAVTSIVILVVMEGLSAFLHTLRLHWVEFMSKFYEGTGYAFEPFSFKLIYDKENEEE